MRRTLFILLLALLSAAASTDFENVAKTMSDMRSIAVAWEAGGPHAGWSKYGTSVILLGDTPVVRVRVSTRGLEPSDFRDLVNSVVEAADDVQKLVPGGR